MISIITAYDDNMVIGKAGRLPWHVKEDLAYFKKTTENHTCVMGRVTFESILKTLKKPLPNRKNIVVSRQRLTVDGVSVIDDLPDFLDQHKDTDEEIFIIGGRLIYKIALPYAKRLYITHIKGTHEGDTFFPEVDFTHYERIFFDDYDKLSFAIYERMR